MSLTMVLEHMPNVKAVAMHLAQKVPNIPSEPLERRRARELEAYEKLIGRAKAVITPMYDYIKEKFGENGVLSRQVTFYQWARLVNPFWAASNVASITVEVVDTLAGVFPVLSNDATRIDSLKAELASYLAACTGLIPVSGNPLDPQISAWWARN